MKHYMRSCNANVLRRGAAAAVASVGVALFILSTAGWLVLRDLSSGAAGIKITLNWTSIVAFGVPFVALTFLILWLSDKLLTKSSRNIVKERGDVPCGPKGAADDALGDSGGRPCAPEIIRLGRRTGPGRSWAHRDSESGPRVFPLCTKIAKLAHVNHSVNSGP